MTQYFNCNYVNTYPDGNYSATTAIYVGNLKPPAQVPPPAANYGLPVTWKPDPSNATPGFATLFEQSPSTTPGGKPTISTFQLPMSEADAQSLGTCLTMATLLPAKCTLGIYSGGIVATSRSQIWQQGPITLNAKAPTSQNFAQNFLNCSAWLLQNPCPPPGKEMAGNIVNTLAWLNIMELGAVGAAFTGPAGFLFIPVIMAGALGALLNETGGGLQVSTAGVYSEGGFTDPVIIPDGQNWGDDQTADLPYNLGQLPVQYYDALAW